MRQEAEAVAAPRVVLRRGVAPSTPVPPQVGGACHLQP